MNKYVYGSLIFLGIVLLFFVVLNKYGMHSSKVHTYVGDCFYIPSKSRHIALLGCTPHPTTYLKEHNTQNILLQDITLDDFLDIEYLHDSFTGTFLLCKTHHIDHLIIAYLPIHFVEIRQLLGDQFIPQCRLFLDRVAKEVKLLVEKATESVGFNGDVTLIIPPPYQLKRVPQKINDLDERIRYLIKQFPVLKNFSESALNVITIINNKASAEDDKLIDYLKYEYLFEKDITFEKCAIGKDRFHVEKKKI